MTLAAFQQLGIALLLEVDVRTSAGERAKGLPFS